MSLRVCLTGQTAIEVDGVCVATDGIGRLGWLALAYLVTERDRPVSRDELADLLWGEALPRSWETSVRVLVSKLRALLARAGLAPLEALTTRSGAYQLHLPAKATVDIDEAAAAVAAAVAALWGGQPAVARGAATEAAAIAARGFLPGGEGVWVERQQAELRALHLQALEALSAAAAGCHDWPAAVQAAEEAIAMEPFREQAWVRLLRAHAAAGNRGEALRGYERCRRLLADELGVGPSAETEAAYRDLLQDAPDPAPGGPSGLAERGTPRVALPPLPPPLTSFVGREDDLAEVAVLLASTRLLTLTGTGGVGKTRLAIQAARLLATEHRDGAALVELAALADPHLVGAHVLAGLGIAQEPGVTPLDTLVAALDGAALLLVLDNCEHLLRPCALLVEALLSRCPGVSILATSREPLRTPGERTLRVRSLSVPDPALVRSTDDLLGFEAVRLFVERSAAASGPALTEANALAAARICAELDGIPLALELAAARTASLSLEDIADRLDNRFPLLASGPRTAPSRQRTLEGAVDWTYEALGTEQRIAFQRLSVFAGDFGLDAAEHLWDGEEAGRVLDLVTSLVECSVLVADTGRGATRYRLPETMRQYAGARLVPTEAVRVRARHLAWATALAERAEDGLLAGGRQAAWLDAADAEQDNLRAALGWATSPAAPPAAGLPLAAALGRFWEVRGHLGEGRRWLEAALASDDGSRPAVRARALNWAGTLAQRQGDAGAARSLLQECLVIRRDLADRAGVAAAVHGLGNLAALEGDAATARTFFEECLAIGRELGEEQTIAASLANLGWVALNQGDLASARAYDEESLALRRSLGDRHGIAMVLGNLGYLAYQEGDFATARAHDEESLALRRELGDRHGIAMLLGNLGHLAFQEGDDATAASLYQESLAMRRELGDRHGQAGSLANLAELAAATGDATGATRHLDAASQLAAELGDRYRTAVLLVSRGRLAAATGDLAGARSSYLLALPADGDLLPRTTLAEWLEGLAVLALQPDPGAPEGAERAARLLGAAAALRSTIGVPVLPRRAAAVEGVLQLATAVLGPDRFAAARTAGQALGPEDAVRLARDEVLTPGRAG